MSRNAIRALIGVSLLFISAQAKACDLCAIYNAVDSSKPISKTFRFGLAEQFTSFGKVQSDGHYIENKGHQHLDSSITQIYSSYDLDDKISFQLNLPYINRRFKRLENGEVDTGTEAGIGDMSLIAKYIPYEYREDEKILFVQLLGGLKFATGSSHRIGEELEEESSSAVPMHSAFFPKHGGIEHPQHDSIPSAIHGHDLALGSGSYDFPVGFNLYAENGKLFAASTVQYTFRTRGAFDYEYADDLTWDVGPGYYLSLCHEYTIAIKANLSGEYKRKDNLNGASAGDTAIRSTFFGPEIVLTTGNWSGELAWDMPLDINNSDFQAVPDYKLRAAVSYRF